MIKQCVIGLAGTTLSEQEKGWLSQHTPKGVILFARNVTSPKQVKKLLSEVRQYAGDTVWIAIDEEGGRVYRMPWSPFDQRMQAQDFGVFFAKDPEKACKVVFDDAFTAGKALKALGFTHNCAPVLDIFHPQGNAIIGNRAYAEDTAAIAALGEACMLGLHQAGIAAIAKHFPGHGRADADSHLAMPVVDTDLPTILTEAGAFKALFAKGLQHVMTAHVRYPNIHPDIATFSPFWLHDVLRTQLGFEGDIWSDDLCMQGCGMPIPEAVTKARQAGCTVLLVCEVEGVEALMQAVH